MKNSDENNETENREWKMIYNETENRVRDEIMKRKIGWDKITRRKIESERWNNETKNRMRWNDKKR